jgi:hypothetical protein
MTLVTVFAALYDLRVQYQLTANVDDSHALKGILEPRDAA